MNNTTNCSKEQLTTPGTDRITKTVAVPMIDAQDRSKMMILDCPANIDQIIAATISQQFTNQSQKEYSRNQIDQFTNNKKAVTALNSINRSNNIPEFAQRISVIINCNTDLDLQQLDVDQ